MKLNTILEINGVKTKAILYKGTHAKILQKSGCSGA